MMCDAVFSPCREYRYVLSRTWLGFGRCVFVMLNPSTATEAQDDPTIRRCIDYAKRWGYGSLYVLNIFALRSTDPRNLYNHPDPVGPDNERHFRAVLEKAALAVCAWGNNGAYMDMDRRAMAWIRRAGLTPRYLKLTKAGQPAHPLYLSRKLDPIRDERHCHRGGAHE